MGKHGNRLGWTTTVSSSSVQLPIALCIFNEVHYCLKCFIEILQLI